MNKESSTVTWYDIGDISNIPQRGSRCIVIGDLKIGVFRTITDNVFALEDKCPHKNGPLSQGIVHDNCVTCPLHNWVIDLESGEAQGADNGSVKGFPIKIENGNVQLGLAPSRAATATERLLE